MKIGIVSDTHRNRSLHESVVSTLQSAGVSKIYHLGDDYADGELEIEYGIELIRVPGLYCPEYRDRTVDPMAFDTIQGIGIVMAHDLKDITKDEVLCHNIILYGHTHRAELRIENGRLFLNPGHLKGDMDKNRAPSYALLDIDFGEIRASLRSPSGGRDLQTLKLRKEDAGLFKA